MQYDTVKYEVFGKMKERGSKDGRCSGME